MTATETALPPLLRRCAPARRRAQWRCRCPCHAVAGRRSTRWSKTRGFPADRPRARNCLKRHPTICAVPCRLRSRARPLRWCARIHGCPTMASNGLRTSTIWRAASHISCWCRCPFLRCCPSIRICPCRAAIAGPGRHGFWPTSRGCTMKPFTAR